MCSFMPDTAGNLKQTESIRLVYDACCRVRALTLADGSVIHREYDALDRLIRTDYPDSTAEAVPMTGPSLLSSDCARAGRSTPSRPPRRVSVAHPTGRAQAPVRVVPVRFTAGVRRSRWVPPNLDV